MVILHHEKAIHMARNRRMAIFTMIIPYVQKCKLDLSLAHCSYTHPDIQEWFLNPDLNTSVESDSWGMYCYGLKVSVTVVQSHLYFIYFMCVL